jgi:hypothetical protein
MSVQAFGVGSTLDAETPQTNYVDVDFIHRGYKRVVELGRRKLDFHPLLTWIAYPQCIRMGAYGFWMAEMDSHCGFQNASRTNLYVRAGGTT